MGGSYPPLKTEYRTGAGDGSTKFSGYVKINGKKRGRNFTPPLQAPPIFRRFFDFWRSMATPSLT